MDFDDIQDRLERLYSAVNERYDQVTDDSITEKTSIRDDGIFEHRITFASNDEAQNKNKVMNVIHAIASLKDHIKNELSEKGNDPQEYEKYIDSNLTLALITDLDNKDKHGETLRTPRTNMNPGLANIQQVLHGKGKTNFGVATSFSNMKSTITHNQGNIKLEVVGDIVDDSDVFVYRLEDAIVSSISLVENFMKSKGIM